MFNSRTNVSSLLVATMSVCACLLLLDSQAFTQQTSFTNKSQSAGFTQGNLLKMEKRAMQPAHGSDLLFFFLSTSGRVRAEEIIYKNLRAPSSSDEVTMAFSMPRETFCALLSKYLSSH